MKEVIEVMNNTVMVDPFTQSYVFGISNIINDIYQGKYGKMVVYANGFRRKSMLAVILESGASSLIKAQDKSAVMNFVREINDMDVDGNEKRILLGSKITKDQKGMKTMLDALADSGAYDWMDNVLGSPEELYNLSLTDLCNNVADKLRNSDLSFDLKKAYATKLVTEVIALVQLNDLSDATQSDITKISSTAALQHRISTIHDLVTTRVNDDYDKGVITIHASKLEELIRDRTIHSMLHLTMNTSDKIITNDAKKFYKDVFSHDFVIDFVLDIIGNLI